MHKVNYESAYLRDQFPEIPKAHETIDFNYTQQEITNKSLDEKLNFLRNELQVTTDMQMQRENDFEKQVAENIKA